MKKRIKLILGLASLSLAVAAFASCASDDYYHDQEKEGSTIRICFDSNGGQFQGIENVSIVDTFNPDNYAKDGEGNALIPLLAPDDSRRGEHAAMSATRTGNFLAGWYANRELRVNDAGQPLDAYGNVLTQKTDEEGETYFVNAEGEKTEQGYVYDGLWDFSKDKLSVKADYDYKTDGYAVTLYAAWVPYYQFDYYYMSNGEWMKYGSTTFDYKMVNAEDSKIADKDTITTPVWKDGAMDYTITYANQTTLNFPKLGGKTFEAAYTDEAKTKQVESITHFGTFDKQHAIAIDPVMNVYTTWQEGTWFHITKAEQFVNNSVIDGCYEIEADLDFDGLDWSEGLSRGNFTGKIFGNGHTMKNITAIQTDSASQMFGGLFGQISADAIIQDLTIENATYNVQQGSRLFGVSFGFLAGTIDANANIKDLSVSGTLLLNEKLIPVGDYVWGKLSGNGVTCGVDFSQIDLVLTGAENENGTYDYYTALKGEIDPESGIFELEISDEVIDTSTESTIKI